jgi:hypothetical protein
MNYEHTLEQHKHVNYLERELWYRIPDLLIF